MANVWSDDSMSKTCHGILHQRQHGMWCGRARIFSFYKYPGSVVAPQRSLSALSKKKLPHSGLAAINGLLQNSADPVVEEECRRAAQVVVSNAEKAGIALTLGDQIDADGNLNIECWPALWKNLLLSAFLFKRFNRC